MKNRYLIWSKQTDTMTFYYITRSTHTRGQELFSILLELVCFEMASESFHFVESRILILYMRRQRPKTNRRQTLFVYYRCHNLTTLRKTTLINQLWNKIKVMKQEHKNSDNNSWNISTLIGLVM